MSMLADWFFCTTMRLSPADTHAFLDTLAVLHRREPDAAEVLDAAVVLEAAPPWLQLYALRPLLAAHGRLGEQLARDAQAADPSAGIGEDQGADEPASPYDDSELSRRVVQIADVVLSSSDHPLRTELGTLLAAVVRDERGTRTALLERVAKLLGEDGRGVSSDVGALPYNDLNDHIVPTLAVIALAELTRRRPTSAIQDWMGEGASPLATAALRGQYGRLALLTAVEAATRADPQARDELWRILWLDGNGAPQLQPDLLDALARLWYGHPDLDGAAPVAVLEAEVLTGDDLALWSAVRPADAKACAEYYALLTGHGGGDWDVMAVVLWQATVWALAAEIDAAETARRLARWWEAPRPLDGELATIHVGRAGSQALEHLILTKQVGWRAGRVEVAVDDAPVEETSVADGAAVFSPWVNRWHDGWVHGRKEGDQAFRLGGRPAEALVRVLLAGNLAVSLLADLPEVSTDDHDHLYRLVFHTVDVIRDQAALLTELERGEYVGEDPLGPALVACLWHTQLVLEQAGTGDNERIDPRRFGAFALRQLADRSTVDLEEDEQRARLTRQSVPVICSLWIRAAWARSSDEALDSGPGRWFLGDPPAAVRLMVAGLDWLSELHTTVMPVIIKYRNRRRKSKAAGLNTQQRSQTREAIAARGLREPDLMPLAQLLRQVSLPDWPVPVGDRWPSLAMDWYEDRQSLNNNYAGLLRKAGGDPAAVTSNTVRAERLLLCPPYELEVWRECEQDLENWTRVTGAPLTMRALRLVALLARPEAAASPEYKEWVEDWLDRIYAIPDESQLSLDIRAMMVRLLTVAPPRPEEEYQRRLSSVHEATIDAILEFGWSTTPRQTEKLLGYLRGALAVGPEGSDRLRLRALQTIYQQSRYRSPSTDLPSVTGVRTSRRQSADREQAIREFLTALASEPVDRTERVPVLERARDLWERTRLSPWGSATRVPLADRRTGRGVSVPDLLVVASLADRFRAEEISYRADVIDPHGTQQSGAATRVHDLFRSPAYRTSLLDQISRRNRTVFAAVAAADGDRLWLNTGLGTPLLYDVPPGGHTARPGEVVAAELAGNPVAVVGLRELQRPDPQPNEVRPVTVRPTRPFPQVLVDGVRAESFPDRVGLAADVVRRRWDPDLSRLFSSCDEEPVRSLARWDAELAGWVPVERTVTELIGTERTEQDELRLVHAGGDLFVTHPGLLYRLPPADWEDPEAAAALIAGELPGTIVSAQWVPGTTPRLRLTGTDDRNLRWLRLFTSDEQEFTVATKGPDGYTTSVVAPEGFPDLVKVGGVEGGPQRVHVITTPWTDLLARLGKVVASQLPVNEVQDKESPTPDRFEQLYDVRERDTVTVQRIFSQHFHSASVWTTTVSGTAVRLETDSLTLLNPDLVGKSARGFVEGRVAEVVRVYRHHVERPWGRGVMAAELAERVHTVDADPGEVLRTVSSGTSISGVIVARVGTSARGGEAMYGTWCRFGTAVHYVEMDQELLGLETGELVGQLIGALRADDGRWRFRVEPREITVRGLFATGDEANAETYQFVGSDGTTDWYQDPVAPRILGRPATGDDVLKRLGLLRAKVELIDRRRLKLRALEVRAGKTALVGVSPFAGDHAAARVTDLRLRVLPSGADPGLIEVRRTIHLTAGGATVAPAARAVDHVAKWQEFVASGKNHVRGAIGGGHADLVGLRVPGPDGRMTARLPLADGEEPAVAGVAYRSNGARLRLVPEGDGFVASYTAADPLRVSEFAQTLDRRGRTDGSPYALPDALYYVGPPTPERDAHVFEWGYGWTVAVAADHLQVGESPDNNGLPPLFHGDRIEAVSFLPSDDGGEPVMVIAWRDIRPRYVTQIVDERRNHQYLHLLELEIGLASGTVRVLRAQTGQRRGDDPFRRAEWIPFPAALDDDSRKLVVQQLQDAGESGVVLRRVLARFNDDLAVSSGGRRRVFRAILPTVGELDEKDRVFLTADRIDESANEVTLVFGIPDALNTNDLEVRVNRRDFSFRESTLGRLLAGGLDLTNPKVVMLVRLLPSRGSGGWYGSVRDAPARRPETLVSHLASRGGAGYAVFGKDSNGDGCLEIAPGVLFSTAGLGAGGIQPGAVVRLSLDKSRRVHLAVALPADRSYVGERGRAAVVFPKTSLLRRNSPLRDQKKIFNGFVVAGLPDVMVSASADAGAVVLAHSHPKVAWVRRNRGAFELRQAQPHEVRVGRLQGPDPAEPASLRSRALPGSATPGPFSVPWARMSFEFTTASRIARAASVLTWRHHDTLTGRVAGTKVINNEQVLPGSLRHDGVFFDNDAGWTLRYPPDRLPDYGYPAGQLLEQVGWHWTFAVAGPSRDGLGVWIELGPGRLVEIRGALVTSEHGSALTKLDWSAFAPGDLITLRPENSDPDGRSWDVGHGNLALLSWIPAVSGVLPRDDRAARVLLPVRGTDLSGGGLHLGDGRWRLVYPLAQSAVAELGEAEAVWLTARNDVEPLAASPANAGDTLLLHADDEGGLAVRGLPGTRVRIASSGEQNWPGGGWLQRALVRPGAQASLLEALGSDLPVTVAGFDSDRSTVIVSRWRQPSGVWPTSRQVRTELLGVHDRDSLLLGSGGAIYSVPLSEAVVGVPAGLAGSVAAALVEAARTQPPILWWTVDADGERTAGLRSRSDSSGHDVVVVPEIEVVVDDVAVGVICRDTTTAKLHWLDASCASWAHEIPAGALLANLKLSGRTVTRLRADGSLTVAGLPAVAYQLRRLELGQSTRIVVGAGAPRPTSDGRWKYVARMQMPSVLVSFVSIDASQEPGSSRLTEIDVVDRSGRPEVVVTDLNSRLVTLDLPQWLPAAHQAVVERSGDLGISRFAQYADWYREGLSATAGGPVEQIVRMAGELMEPDAAPAPEELLEVVGRWLVADGRAVLNLVAEVELDLAPALAGAVVIDRLALVDPAWEPLSVFLVHQIGRRAVASLHTEQLAAAWIGRPDRHQLAGAWARLRSLELAREIGPRQVRHVREFCRAMLTKPALRTPETALAPIARSLLAAVGDLESAEDLVQDAAVLAGPAAWARALLPPAGYATAQPRLLPQQSAELRKVAEHVIADALPLTLLPVVARLGKVEQDLARKALRELVGRLPDTREGEADKLPVTD